MWTYDSTAISAITAKGIKVFCSFSVGLWESSRVDAGNIPINSRGNYVDGTNNQRYLDLTDYT